MSVIKVCCSTADSLPYTALTAFQGDLKHLSEDGYKKLRGEIITGGFSFAIHVWKNGEKNYVIDGHQRLTTIKRMVEEDGFVCPHLPVVFIEAATLQEAKAKVLAGTSQYGEMTPQSVYTFALDSGFDFNDINGRFDFPSIDLGDLRGTFDDAALGISYDETDLVADGDIQGDHCPITNYLVVTFPTAAEFQEWHDRLGLPGKRRTVSFVDFVDRLKGELKK